MTICLHTKHQPVSQPACSLSISLLSHGDNRSAAAGCWRGANDSSCMYMTWKVSLLLAMPYISINCCVSRQQLPAGWVWQNGSSTWMTGWLTNCLWMFMKGFTFVRRILHSSWLKSVSVTQRDDTREKESVGESWFMVSVPLRFSLFLFQAVASPKFYQVKEIW